ncbi:hypothetical protein K0B96_08550 [Horticoccus luteus]|uniref:Uncharacterized protein n=1 Tax=Horticoccus luteus TaxID=2862869 RepID=A0A8F9XIQ3_9BACT|nr:hypothetical protein [Horticoccus luteus]QYM80635.1 hypothetical protein K0B96_08550 [Horticoccus luteus]
MMTRWKVPGILAAVAVAGLGLAPVARRAESKTPRVGGLRAAAADVLWLRAYVQWERHDRAGVMAELWLTTTLNPEPVYFWLNGARMIAHDMSTWRIDAAGKSGEGEATKIEAEQARVALRWLDRAELAHPGDVRLQLERASITLIRLHDVRRAALLYRRAAERPGAPFFAGRLAAELWRRAGEPAEAYRWLCEWYPTLPANDEAAEAPLVLARIRELERTLHVPAHETFREPATR